MTWLIAAFSGSIAGLPEPADAEPERYSTAAFATPLDPSGQKAAAAIGALLRKRVAANPKLNAIDPGRILAGDPKTREEETLDRARTALADGRRAYDALELDEAIARLGQSVTLYQQAGPLLLDMSELSTALAHLGAALTLRGSTEEGVSTFVELLTVSPAYNLDGFPPAVMKVFDKALEAIGEAARGSVEIYSTPPYAAVFLDGEFRGVTPVTLDDPTGGTHYLRLERDGYVVYGGPLEVTANQRITSQTKLTSIRRGAELRDLLSRSSREVPEEGMGGQLRQLGRLASAETLIVISVSQSNRDVTLVGGVFDVDAATRLSTERAVVGADSPSFTKDVETMIAKLETAAARGTAAPELGSGGSSLAGFGLSTGAGAGQGSGKAPQSGSGVRARRTDGTPPPGKALGWILIGTGIAAIGTGGVFGILALQTHSDFEQTSQASPDLADIQSAGNTKALVADVLMIGGAVAIVGGFVTLILTDRNAPPKVLSSSQLGFSPTVGGGVLTVGGRL